MKDNKSIVNCIHLIVVNCFQKLLSSWWRTTYQFKALLFRVLWIAFKNYYLRDEGQPTIFRISTLPCCELLSKIIIFVMKDNLPIVKRHYKAVVNCFQKLLSSWWRTTPERFVSNNTELWIAFKNYYLRDEGQQPPKNGFLINGCELLSKIIIFVMKDNTQLMILEKCDVVNCFQKLLSSWWRTTFVSKGFLLLLLWIAFKNYYLRDEGQLFSGFKLPSNGCELLSKIIIFVMKDNE